MTDTTAKRFEPNPPSAGFLRRLLWACTPHGRAKLTLRKACLGSPKALSRVDAVIERWSDLDLNDNRSDTLNSLLAHAAAHALDAADLGKADACFERLQERSPTSAQTAQLSWDLAWAHARAQQLDEFVAYATKFQNHPLPGDDHESSIALLYDHAYRHQRADDLVQNAGDSVQTLSCVEAVRVISAFPAWFPDAEQISSAREQLETLDTGFSSHLSRDRLLLYARCDAWTGDLEHMDHMLTQAQTFEPEAAATQYWRAWHALASAVRDQTPLPRWVELPPGDDEPYAAQHLRALSAVYRSRKLAAVDDYLGAFLYGLNNDNLLHEPDRQLALAVLSGVLTLDWRDDDDALALGDRLCLQLSEEFAASDESLPWCHYGRAVHALCVECDTRTTLHLLRDCEHLADGTWLRQAAEFLAGNAGLRDSLLDVLQLPQAPEGFLARIPGLSAAVEFIAGSKRWLDDYDAAQLPPSLPARAPAWTHWLHARLAAAGLPEPQLVQTCDAWLVDHPAVAYELASFLEERCSMLFNSEPLYERLAEHARPVDVAQHGFELGEIADGILQEESRLGGQYHGARVALREGDIAHAGQEFDALVEQLETAPSVTRARWLPLVTYWRAMTYLADNDRDRSQILLNKVTSSWIGARAKAQLALIAMQGADLVAADAQLAGIPETTTEAAHYAKAVLADRQGDPIRAQRYAMEIIESTDSARPPLSGTLNSTYGLHAQRLLVALAERGGDPIDEQLTGVDDQRSQLRALSRDLAQWYRLLGTTTKQDDADQVVTTLKEKACAIEDRLTLIVAGSEVEDEYLQRIRLLSSVLCDPANSLPRSIDTGQQDALRPARALWRIRTGSLDAALAEIKAMQSPPEIATLCLSTASLLQSLSERVDLTQADLSELDDQRIQLAANTHMPQVMPWLRFLEVVASTLNAGEEIPAGEAVLPIKNYVSDGSLQVTATQHAMLDFISATAGGDDDTALAAYDKLRAHIEELPMAGIDIWLYCAGIWLAQKNWPELLDHELPECVADLEDERVRWAIGLAYSCAGAEAAEAGRTRDALSFLSRAATTLEPLEDRHGTTG